MNTNHDAIRAGVDQLWSDLETTRHLTTTELATLRSLDDKAVDGRLTERELQAAREDLAAPALFGDFELIIDRCLGGDPAIKDKVRKADANGRRGLASLKYHLQRAKVALPAAMQHVMRVCEADQEYYENRLKDRKNIEEHHGKFRVSVMADGKRKRTTFDTLEIAQAHRDSLTATF